MYRWEDNKSFCRTMGIRSLPVVILVAGQQGKVDTFVCGPKKFTLLEEKLSYFAAGGAAADAPFAVSVELADTKGLDGSGTAKPASDL